MITIRKSSLSEDYELVVDDVVFTKDEVSVHMHRTIGDPNMELVFSVRARAEEANRLLLAQHFFDMPDDIRMLGIEPAGSSLNSDDSESGSLYIDISILKLSASDMPQILYGVGFDSDAWKGAWSIAEYVSEFENVFNQRNLLGPTFATNDDEISSGGFKVNFPVTQPKMLIGEMISNCTALMDELNDLTQSALMAKIDAESLVVQFDFPEEVKVACEQYLLYFVQFLKDLGVEADAELQHEAGQVLFAVTPTNKEEALDKIRDALGTYLQLAASPVNVASVLSSDIEVQRLSANIQHLQGQLTLAHAVLQSKDATIQLQQTHIEQQRRALGGEVLINSMKNVTPKSKDSEEVLGGLAEITKYEGKGFNLNLPEAFRRLKEAFKEKKGGKK